MCLTLFDSMDYRQSGSSVHGILQARMLEWVAIPFFRESFQPRDPTQVSCTAGGFFTIWATIALFYTSKKLNHSVFPKTVCETDYCLIFSPLLSIISHLKFLTWLFKNDISFSFVLLVVFDAFWKYLKQLLLNVCYCYSSDIDSC